MATIAELLGAITHVTSCAGDSHVWLTGFTAQDVTEVATIDRATPQRVEQLLEKIHSAHPKLFDPALRAATLSPTPQSTETPAASTPTDQQGAAADAIRSAESALAQQNTSTAQLDLQVIGAVLNAHLTAADGSEALNRLQHDVESAVQTRTDLDTNAGARDFQRFLLGKLTDMRALVAGGSLDSTSKSTLMAALTSLYHASREAGQEPTERNTAPVGGARPPSDVGTPDWSDIDSDPDSDGPFGDEDLFPTDSLPPTPASMASMPGMPAAMGLPPFGGAAMPGLMPSWGASGGSPIPDLVQSLGKRNPTDDDLADEDAADDDADSDDPADNDADEPADDPEPAGPTKVALPDGETVTASNPKLAAVIETAINGTPIADAFQTQGITIPQPGTAVTDRIDPPQLSPGDIGMFTDHHVLALGPSRVLVNGQIQHISTVQGPSFLGWEHPPATETHVAPEKTKTPTPTRPAVVATT